MKFLILNTDYPEFLMWLYNTNPGLESLSYDEQMKVRAESLFGVADFYSRNLKRLGHEAWDIHCNNEAMQKAWAREKGIPLYRDNPFEKIIKGIQTGTGPLFSKGPFRTMKTILRPLKIMAERRKQWLSKILSCQIMHYRPDVLINQAMESIDSTFLKEMRQYVGLMVGQIASPIPEGRDFRVYDLIITSLPNFVDYFRAMGIPCELNRFAFDESVLSRPIDDGEPLPVSFVGSLSSAHRERISLLEYLCTHIDIRVWGTGTEGLSSGSPILKKYMGHAWGKDMYRILKRSKITVNNHIGVAGPYANNMRLFEATGVGTLLVTDWKENLHEMFEVGREIVAYRDEEECLHSIKYYLENEEDRKSIARAGQIRTLKEHTYLRRMEDLSQICERYIRDRRWKRV